MLGRLHPVAWPTARSTRPPCWWTATRWVWCDFGDAGVGAGAGRQLHDRAQAFVPPRARRRRPCSRRRPTRTRRRRPDRGAAVPAAVRTHRRASAIRSRTTRWISTPSAPRPPTPPGWRQPELLKLRRDHRRRRAARGAAGLGHARTVVGHGGPGTRGGRRRHPPRHLVARRPRLRARQPHPSVPGGVSTLGASPTPMPFGPVYALQLSMAIHPDRHPVVRSPRGGSRSVLPASGDPVGRCAGRPAFIDVMTTLLHRGHRHRLPAAVHTGHAGPRPQRGHQRRQALLGSSPVLIILVVCSW